MVGAGDGECPAVDSGEEEVGAADGADDAAVGGDHVDFVGADEADGEAGEDGEGVSGGRVDVAGEVVDGDDGGVAHVGNTTRVNSTLQPSF